MAAAQRFEEHPPSAVFKHSKVSLAVRPTKALFVTGNKVEGVLELACSSDKVCLGRIGLECRGAERSELQSLDHAASHTFLQAEVAFQSPSLPPSNAVVSTKPSSGGYWPGRKGVTRFPFSFDIPVNCPSSCVFGNNASITYALQGTVHVQHQGERQILTKRVELLVVESWSDWQAEQFHEVSDAQKRERVTAGLGFGSEGSVWVEASIPDPFFFRGWDIGSPAGGSGNVERERARGEVGVNLAVKNATSKTISGIKLTLIRRMTILPSSPAGAIKGNMAEGLRVSEIASEISLNGYEWEFPAGGEERRVQCWTDLAKPEKLLSIRKTRLFQVQTLLKVNLDMGTWHKDLSLELPIWVAHWASLPQNAFVRRQPAMAASNAQWISPSHSPVPHAQYAMVRPASAQPYSPLTFASPALPSPSFSTSIQQSPVQDQYISFDPYAPSLTQSTFINALNSPQPAANWQAQQMGRPASAMDSRQHAAPLQFSSSVPSTTFFQQPVPFHSVPTSPSSYYPQPDMPRSQSAQPYSGWQTSYMPVRNTLNHTQRPLSPELREYLSEEDQARVLANSMPTHYDVGDRGRTLSQQQLQQQSYSADGSHRNRRQSMPAPSNHAMERSNSWNRPNKTPPLARSSSSRFDVLPSQDTFTSFPSLPAHMHTLDGLETIGEDGESQAGTLRIRNGSGFLVRSASHDNVRSLRAVRAMGSADEGNTSASLLEALVDKQDREKEAEKSGGRSDQENILAEMDAYKTLPPPPVPTGKDDKKKDEKRRVFDIFPTIGKDDAPTIVKPVPSPAKSASNTNRRTSAPIAKTEVLARPTIRASNSESLLALETRLLRPSSPATTAEPPARSTTISPPLRTRTTSPVQRAISPMHTGNAGALRKKSSQVVLKQKASSAAPVKTEDPCSTVKREDKGISSNLSGDGAKASAAGVESSRAVKQLAQAAKIVPATSSRAARTTQMPASTPNTSTPPKAKPKERDSPSPLPSPAFAHLSPAPIRSREASPAISPKLKPPISQRSVSDPQPSPLQVKSKNAASPGLPEKRRQSHEVLLGGVEGGTAYDVRSARGGRGGRVTNVASQWASLIAENDKAKDSKPIAQVEPVKLPKAPLKAEVKPVAKLDAANKAAKPFPTSIAKTASPSPMARMTAPPKGAIATTLLNNTIGKPPTFASARAKAAIPAHTTPITSTSSEQAQGLGAQRLKALIEKFN